jgi:hypothetical protein
VRYEGGEELALDLASERGAELLAAATALVEGDADGG